MRDKYLRFLLNDNHGGPISPVALNLVTDEKVLSTYDKDAKHDKTHLEELENRVNYIETCDFKRPLVHIIDREGDSVQLMRALKGKQWLVRCRSNSHVEYDGASLRVDNLAKQLLFTHARTIQYKGQKAEQHLAEAEVSVTRVAKPKKTENGKTENKKMEKHVMGNKKTENKKTENGKMKNRKTKNKKNGK